MLWYRDMACGVHLGILLICFVQAEHVCCFWVKQAQGQNSNANVGYLQQQDGGLRRLSGSSPQNEVRQDLVSQSPAQTSSFNVQRGYSQGLYSNGKAVSQPAQSSYSSVRVVKVSPKSNLRVPTSKAKLSNTQKAPTKIFGLSTAIVSGTSVSKYNTKKQNDPEFSKNSLLLQQGTQHSSPYLPSRSVSTAASWGHRSLTPASYDPRAPKINQEVHAQNGAFSPRSLSTGASAQMQTSASGQARRVISRGRSMPKDFSPQSFNSYQSKPYSVSGGKAQRSNAPVAYASSHYTQQLPASTYKRNIGPKGTSTQPFSPTETYNIPARFGGSAIRRLKEPEQKAQGISKLQLQRQQAWIKPPVQSVYQKAS